MKDINIGPRISSPTASWLENNFSSRNAGAEIILESMPALFHRSLKTALARLSNGEKSLLIDLHNGYAITPQILGQGLPLQVRDGIELDAMDKKWEIDGKALLKNLSAMHPFDLACLEIWATAFWQAGHCKRENAVEAYIK